MKHLARHWLVPHYTNNHRPKVIHPSGLTMVVAIFLFFQIVLQMVKLTSLPGGLILGFASSITPSQVVELTNAERAKSGLSPLIVNEKLNQAATAKATHMFANDYWSHIAPDGTTPWVFMKNASYAYSVAGENLARDFGDAPTMIQAWMNSPTHRTNIVHTKYREIGIAVVNGKLQGVDTTLVVQMFGNPTSYTAQTSPKGITATSSAIKDTKKTLDVAQLRIEPQQDVTFQAVQGSNTRAISPLTLTKIFSSFLIMLLVAVLVYDSYLTSKKGLPRRVGNNWAHVVFLGIVLALILIISKGNIL